MQQCLFVIAFLAGAVLVAFMARCAYGAIAENPPSPRATRTATAFQTPTRSTFTAPTPSAPTPTSTACPTATRPRWGQTPETPYYSGHGHHAIASLQGDFTPAMARLYWNRDLDVAIIAACSVLDINDYNGLAGNAAASPGKAWEQAGPGILLGYNYVAPGDAGGAPERIMRFWVANRGSLGDVNAWMEANARNKAWNACAVVKDQKYVFFESYFMKKFKRVKEVPKGDW